MRIDYQNLNCYKRTVMFIPCIKWVYFWLLCTLNNWVIRFMLYIHNHYEEISSCILWLQFIFINIFWISDHLSHIFLKEYILLYDNFFYYILIKCNTYFYSSKEPCLIYGARYWNIYVWSLFPLQSNLRHCLGCISTSIIFDM